MTTTPAQAVANTIAFFEANPTAWTSGSLARDAEGEPVMPTSGDACSWCGIGRMAYELRELVDAEPTDQDWANPFYQVVLARIFKPLDRSASEFAEINDNNGLPWMLIELDEIRRVLA